MTGLITSCIKSFKKLYFKINTFFYFTLVCSKIKMSSFCCTSVILIFVGKKSFIFNCIVLLYKLKTEVNFTVSF